MTQEDKGNYAKKHPSDRKMRTDVGQAVEKKASQGEISCAAAFSIVGRTKRSMLCGEISVAVSSERRMPAFGKYTP